MPYVSSDMSTAMLTNIKALFLKFLGEMAGRDTDWQKIATIMPSDSDKEEYNWLGATPPMIEWKDVRQLHGLRPYSYTLTNQDWEATLEIARNAFHDNKLGHIPKRVESLAASYYKRVVEEVFSKLDYGETGTAYDGTAFFSDSRTIGDSGTIDNLLSMACSGSTTEVRAAVVAAVDKMMNFKDDWGKPLGLKPDTIVCAPEMYITIAEALKADVAGHQRTESEFVKNIIVSSWIDLDATDWYLLCTTEPVKPIIFQDRQKPEVTALDKPDSPEVFLRKMLLYGVDARFTVGFGDPRTAILLKDA